MGASRFTQEIKRRLHGIPEWQEVDGGAYAVACFQTQLAGWDRDRRFVVVRERVRAEKAAVGRKLLDVPGYTFRVWVTKRLLPIGKAYSGLTDAEIAQMTEELLSSVLHQEGRLHHVDPQIVLEIAFDSIQPSDRHASGLAMRFPRIKGIRRDKTPAEIDTLATARKLVAR